MNEIQELLEQIRSGKDGRDKVVASLYHDQKLRNVISGYIKNRGGDETDVKSVFNLSLVQFVKTVVKNPNLEIKTSIYQFVFGIARHRWIDELESRSNKKTSELKEYHKEIKDDQKADDLIINFENKALLNDLLEKLRRNCKQVLMYWANGYSMEEIAKMLNYNSFKMAKKKKYECFKQLLKYLDQNPQIKMALR
ncbi:RNA polymerase sigma factor [Portibacter lacus]|uniref:RNA polymerase sigma-70 ECF-like HTH domain-containing protein n=1 Tax=Portibacter lacus TaxID=1099794 RepID=A0AA37SPY0_9BACT|nr:sigma-70 family RNA polymerase sigma factor [Portibacter lacus]GLR16578.1 hypothetical protein GCM10007940_11930 [Portibacter lacus]